LPYNLVVSPRNNTIDPDLLARIRDVNRNYAERTGHRAGGVYRYDPATGDLVDIGG